MAAPEIEGGHIVGLDARAVQASVRVVSQASAADLARALGPTGPGERQRYR